MSRSYFRMSRTCFGITSRYLRVLWFIPLFLFIILAGNINCKSILQKTLKQFGLVVQNTSENRDTRTIFSASYFAGEFAYVPICRAMFLQSAFQFGFLPSKPCLFPLKSSLEFVLHRGKPKFINLPVKFPADRSKFQFRTTARSKLIIIFTRTVMPCLRFFSSKSSSRNNAKYAFPYTFKNNTTQ